MLSLTTVDFFVFVMNDGIVQGYLAWILVACAIGDYLVDIFGRPAVFLCQVVDILCVLFKDFVDVSFQFAPFSFEICLACLHRSFLGIRCWSVQVRSVVIEWEMLIA
jgi:hypothetical protein